jgi:hypothetical protein
MVTAVRKRNPLRWAWRLAVVALALVLAALDLLVVSTQMVYATINEAGFSWWAFLWAALTIAPFIVVYGTWRRGRRRQQPSAAVVWDCTVALLVVGLVTLPFALLIIAIP